jgi:hypothetical protein
METEYDLTKMKSRKNPDAAKLKLDAFEQAILADYESGALQSTSPSKAKLAILKAAASTT